MPRVATAATAAAEARWRIIAAGEVVSVVVAAFLPLCAPGRASGPCRGGLPSLGLRAASDRDMNWPRVPGGGLVL